MCGIAGIYHTESHQQVDQRMLRRMTDALAHRGPDDAATRTFGHVGLGFRRLAIIDTSAAGNQPLSNEDGSVWVVCNGEIYNFRELRQRLTARGHRFRTGTDIETIVHLYEDLGESCVSELQGMFAFALWDDTKKRLVLARDRLGIKPLVVSRTRNRLLFASEIRSLLEVPDLPRDIDHQAFIDYLAFNSVPQPETILSSVRKVRPGHVLIAEGDRFVERQYWDVPVPDVLERSSASLEEEVRHRFSEVVRQHLVSDVPLGAFLSGGVDSSLVVAMMRAHEASTKTFSVSFPGETEDEGHFARMVSDHLGTDHRVFEMRPNLVQDLQTIAHWSDEPFGISSALPLFHLCRMAREHVTVALSGDGGDEVFAGYAYRLRLDAVVKRLRWIPRSLGRFAAAAIRTTLAGPSDGGGAFADKLRYVANAAHGSADDVYLRSLTVFDDRERERLVQGSLGHLSALAPPGRIVEDHYGARHFRSPLQRRLYADLKSNLVDEMLMKVDRMSMANSLEVRVPFLDHTLVEFAMALPDDMKMKDREGKVILRNIARTLVPAAAIDRPKHGFNTPIDAWFRKDLAGFVRDVLSPDELRKHGLLEPRAVTRIIDDHVAGRAANGSRLYSLLSFQLWFDNLQRVNRV